jgi:hypothetical protein
MPQHSLRALLAAVRILFNNEREIQKLLQRIFIELLMKRELHKIQRDQRKSALLKKTNKLTLLGL